VGASVPALPQSTAAPLPTRSPTSGASPEAEPLAVPLSLFGLEFSLATASLDALEGVTRTVTRAQVAAWFARLPGTEEVALLSTCHRVEIALLVRFAEELDRWRELLPGAHDAWKLREGREVVHHLFRVAAGRESLAVGEAEVRDQVRTAGNAVVSRHPRPLLYELFAGAARSAEEVSPSVPLSCSIASIAATRLRDLVGRPFPRVLVVGSGTVGRQVTESLAPSARVTIVFHRTAPDDAFLRETGARAVGLDQLVEEIAASDAIVTAAKFGNHGLRAADLPRDRGLVLVDLGVPRNIDPGVRELPNVRLVDLEELHALSETLPANERYDARVEERAGEFSDRFERGLLEPWIDAFRRAAEELRRSELSNARPFLGRLEPDQEVAIERLTRRLVARLLLPPTERIRSLPPGPEGDLRRRFAIDLLRPRPVDP
jgi:glutamyl-tRNA reductase